MIKHRMKEHCVERTALERKRGHVGLDKGQMGRARMRGKLLGGSDRVRLDINADRSADDPGKSGRDRSRAAADVEQPHIRREERHEEGGLELPPRFC